MTREEYIKVCSVCTNRAFSPKHGIICGLTDAPADFAGTCKDYNEDADEVRHEEIKVRNTKSVNQKGINRGRIALFVIAGLYAFVGFYEAFVMPGADILFGAIDWTVGAVFVGLGIWSYRKPLLAMIIGLSFYVLIILLLAVIDPFTIIQGIIWKVLIIVWFVYGISAARREKEKEKNVPSSELLDQL